MEIKIKLSIIIPVYNTEEYLEECIDSAINQTLKEIEIICIDDGSTDSSPEILNRKSQEDSRIIVVSKENGGQSSARNVGLNNANGKYVYFLDSDDFITSDAMEKCYCKSEELNLDILYFSANTFFTPPEIEEDFLFFKNRYIRKGKYENAVIGVEMFNALDDYGDYQTSACLLLYNLRFINELGLRFKEGIIHEDDLFTFQAIINAKSVSAINDALYERRVRPNSIMTEIKQVESFICRVMCFMGMLDAVSRADLRPSDSYGVLNFITMYRGIIWDMFSCFSNQEKQLLLDIVDDINVNTKINLDTESRIKVNWLIRCILLEIEEKNTNLQDCIQQLESEKRCYVDIENSKSYRLGNFLISPYRRIKGIFNR